MKILPKTVKTPSEVHFRVCDKGLFLPIAQRLARDARKVSYWTPNERAFPKVSEQIGDGLPDITMVDSLFKDLDDVDCFVFPDVGMSEYQLHLQNMGKPVWGARYGCELETKRGLFLKTIEELGLEVPKYEKVKGITALHQMLKGEKDRWIKISKFRGDWETFHWRDEEQDGNVLDYYATRFGPFRELITFYVFEPIDAEIEDGCDSWCVDGQFPKVIVHGMEAKDKAFIGALQRYADLPEQVRHVNDAMAPVLERYGYRSFFSTEVRITKDDHCFFIDPTCRAGSPPSQVMAEMIDNYADVIWYGANGILINPKSAALFGVQALCNTKRDPDCWTYVKLNGDLDRWLKSSNALGFNNMLAYPPGDYQTGCEDWLVGVGDTLPEAIKHLQHNTKQLPDGVSCDCKSLVEVLQEIEQAEESGMEFTDQPVPGPEVVIDNPDN